MLTFLDVNAILRFLLRDIEEQAQIVRKHVAEGAETSVEVLAEVVYVLMGVYKAHRSDISAALVQLCDDIYVHRADEVVLSASIFEETKLDFVDCLIVARKRLSGQDVLTFDKRLIKELNKGK
ncbi:MAG: PIN domain-containing protein [Eggerthellaceae bacterium]|nr:PIN domain-containing protein [Eggerthellaceae bacterium]